MRLNDVPIVGQVLRVHAGEALAVATCNCESDNQPFVIPTVYALVTCNKCKGIYRIVGVSFDASKQEGLTVAVAQVGKAVAEPKATVN